jgi:hypothetical protein
LGPGPSFRYAAPEEEEEAVDEEQRLTNTQIQVFPNPTTGRVTIVLPVVPEKPWRYVLSGLQGKALKQGALLDQQQVIVLENAAAGLYYLQIFEDAEQRHAQKLVILDE